MKICLALGKEAVDGTRLVSVQKVPVLAAVPDPEEVRAEQLRRRRRQREQHVVAPVPLEMPTRRSQRLEILLEKYPLILLSLSMISP